MSKEKVTNWLIAGCLVCIPSIVTYESADVCYWVEEPGIKTWLSCELWIGSGTSATHCRNLKSSVLIGLFTITELAS
jgi:hypothetical protein